MNKNLFQITPGKLLVPADTVNQAGGAAYQRTPDEALAQFAATGCLGGTFYASAEDQLTELLALANKCSPEWVAKCAIYARRAGAMKDTPAVLCASLAKRDLPLLKKVFPLVIDNGKMLRNFVTVVRSGVTGRKSFGTAVKKLIQQWFNTRTDEQLFHASIGTAPSLGDIIKMVHPKPKDEARRMMLAYLIGREVTALGLLPDAVQKLEALKMGVPVELPDVNFQFLSSMELTKEQWQKIADGASWTTLRMNLNTFQRHGAFENVEVLTRAIHKLTDPEQVKRARPMPHQLMTAFQNLSDDVPPGFKMALARAVELSLANVPALPARTIIGIDVSGSMTSALTGARGSATSKTRCIDLAALFGVAVLRTTPTARLVAFSDKAHTGKLGGSLVEAAMNLAAIQGGGTDCSIPLVIAAQQPAVDAVVIVSDSESWIDPAGHGFRSAYGRYGTPVMQAWRAVQQKNPKAKLVCIDLTPSSTKQTVSEPNILNVGGFSDAVFDVVAKFLNTDRSWKDVIAEVDIGAAAR